jgi:hypothetical protein
MFLSIRCQLHVLRHAIRLDDQTHNHVLDDQVIISAEGIAVMVGQDGLEPSTLRLSGVRSNHLSY